MGESGGSNSVAARSIMPIIKSPPGKIVEGEVIFHPTRHMEKTIVITRLDPTEAVPIPIIGRWLNRLPI